MNPKETNTTELLLLVLLLQSTDDDDGFMAEELYDRFRMRLRNMEGWDPHLDDIFRHAIRARRGRSSRIHSLARETAISVFEGHQSEARAEHQRATESLTAGLDQLRTELSVQNEVLTSTQADIAATTIGLRDLVWRRSLGLDEAEIREVRFVPVRAFVGDPVPSQEILDGICKRIESFALDRGFAVAAAFPPEAGSWWKKFLLKTRQAATHEEVLERLGKVERGFELQYLDGPQSEANKNQAEAVACLLQSMKDISSGCIQVGSLLVVKATDLDGRVRAAARTLTIQELKRIESNQAMLGQPTEILSWLGAS